MSITKVDNLQELLAKSDALLEDACARKASVFLVVPSHKWGEERKLQLRSIAPTGVQALTFPQLVEQLWELFGDGRAVVQDLERTVLLRPLVTQVGLFAASPSPRFLAQLSSFVQEAVCPGLEPSSSLTGSESRLMELVSLYEQKLAAEGLVDLAQAEAALLDAGVCDGMSFVFEAPDLHSARVRRFIAGLEQCAYVHVIEQRLSLDFEAPLSGVELADVSARLFTGRGGVSAQGHVRVGEAQGSHVEAAVIARLAQIIHEQDGIAYGDIALCVPHSASGHAQLLQELALAGIPFQTRFSVPLARTGLGAAFCAIERLQRAATDEEAFQSAVDLIGSPYSGVPPKDARALQMRWRERSHSTQEDRLFDVRNGFEQGNATMKIVKERFEPLEQLLDATRDERVALLFAHAKQAHAGVDALIDDRQAADSLLSYLETCERFNCLPDLNEMANIPVALTRAHGDQADALSMISARDIGPGKVRAIIMCGLDAASYPMAAQSGPFDALMIKLGINRADTLAQDQRIMLLNLLEAAQERFAFERATHNTQGDESCQSALFEELLAVYRSAQEDEEGLPVQAVPQALQPWLCSMSEADALIACAQDPCTVESVTRGALDSQFALSSLLQDAKGRPQVFSPTALEDYYRCPYRWFTSRRVGYNGMDTAFDAAAQGNLVHAVMERFYKELAKAGHQRVTPSNLEEALQIASAAFDAQVELEKARERRGLYLKTQADQLVCEGLRTQVLALVERDATFLPGFVPTYFELEPDGGDGTLLEYAGVPVRGKVDRIDVDANGNAVIIDYKLSGLSQGYGFAPGEEMPKRIQTDIYATLVQRHFDARGIPLRVLGSVYRSYSANLLRGVYDRIVEWGTAEKVRDKHDALPHQVSDETYEGYLQRVESVVASCVDRLKMGDIAPDPIAKDACEYCKGFLFCPRREG